MSDEPSMNVIRVSLAWGLAAAITGPIGWFEFTQLAVALLVGLAAAEFVTGYRSQ